MLVSFVLFKEMNFDIDIVHSFYHLFSVSLLSAPVISTLLVWVDFTDFLKLLKSDA